MASSAPSTDLTVAQADAVSTATKRKVEDLDLADEDAVSKAARPSDTSKSAGEVVAESNAAAAAAKAEAQVEKKFALYTMCAFTSESRLSANVETDPIVSIGLLYGQTPKVSTASPATTNGPDAGGVTRMVLHYTDQPLQNTERYEAAGTLFHKCDNEVEMLKMFKAIWDEQNPDVIVGHQLMLFDLWFLIRRAAHLGVQGINTLGRGNAAVSTDAVLPMSVIAGAGGPSSYPIATHASKRALRDNRLNQYGGAPALAAPPAFNRRIEIPGRKVDDVWERLQGRFSLKDYGIRRLTTNFLVKDKEPDTPPFAGEGTAITRIPAIAAAHVDALSKLRDIVDSMPDFVAFCFRCKQPGHNAKQCKVGLVCNNCGQPGHKVTHCPSTTCKTCGRTGHSSSVCFKLARCTKCGQMGHTATKCVRSMQCTSCGGFGHLADRCFSTNPCQFCGGRHRSEKCYKNHVCTICGKKGHMEARCYNAQPGGVPRHGAPRGPMNYGYMAQQPGYGAAGVMGHAGYYQQQQGYRQPMAGQAYNAQVAAAHSRTPRPYGAQAYNQHGRQGQAHQAYQAHQAFNQHQNYGQARQAQHAYGQVARQGQQANQPYNAQAAAKPKTNSSGASWY